MDAIIAVVMVTTITFADGTPPEQYFQPQPSAEVCVEHLKLALKTLPPERTHPVDTYSVMCAVGTDSPGGFGRKT